LEEIFLATGILFTAQPYEKSYVQLLQGSTIGFSSVLHHSDITHKK